MHYFLVQSSSDELYIITTEGYKALMNIILSQKKRLEFHLIRLQSVYNGPELKELQDRIILKDMQINQIEAILSSQNNN